MGRQLAGRDPGLHRPQLRRHLLWVGRSAHRDRGIHQHGVRRPRGSGRGRQRRGCGVPPGTAYRHAGTVTRCTRPDIRARHGVALGHRHGQLLRHARGARPARGDHHRQGGLRHQWRSSVFLGPHSRAGGRERGDRHGHVGIAVRHRWRHSDRRSGTRAPRGRQDRHQQREQVDVVRRVHTPTVHGCPDG